MDKGFTALVFLVLILNSSVTGYAQEVDGEILRRHYQPPMFVQLSDQTYLLGDTDVESREPQRGKPPLSDRIAGEIAVGAVGGLAGTTLAFSVFQLFDDPECDDCVKHPYLAVPTVLLAMVAGPTLGSTCGVYLVGNIGDETGSFLATLGGSAVGATVGLVSIIACIALEEEDICFLGGLLFLLGPPIGALIGFNRTRRYDSPPAESETALINVRDSQMSLAVPRVYFRTDSLGRGGLSQNVDLLRVRF